MIMSVRADHLSIIRRGGVAVEYWLKLAGSDETLNAVPAG
jgi:hypothetical protein